MRIKRQGSALWNGGLKDGRGSITTQSGALSTYPYGFASRFEGTPGTNPEELLGAAHAGCFTMALSMMLGEAGYTPTQLNTTAEVTLEKQESGFAIPSILLKLKGKVPGIDAATFHEIAKKAEANCPVSKLFRAEISLEAELLT